MHEHKALPLCRTKNIVKAAVQKRNSEALSAMTFAATLGDVDSMEHLLQRGLLINTADYDGRTTLHLAALEGNVKVLELLLQEGADPNVRDRSAIIPTFPMIPPCFCISTCDMALRAKSSLVLLMLFPAQNIAAKQQTCKQTVLKYDSWLVTPGTTTGGPSGCFLPACRWGHTPLQHAVSRRHGPAIEVLQKYDARLG